MHALLDQGLTIIKEIFDKMAFGINAVIIKKSVNSEQGINN